MEMILTTIIIVMHIALHGLASDDMSFYDANKYEGDICTLADGVTSGTCRRDTNCLYLRTIPQSDWKTCSFVGNTSIVCCLNMHPSSLSVSRSDFNYKSDEMCASFPEMPITGNHILNGTDAAIEDFPYLGALALRHQYATEAAYSCGANLISDRFMLTAAHCLFGRQLDHVRLGTVSLENITGDDAPVLIGAEQVFIHPNYNPRSRRNDIALIKLDRTVDEEFLVPACLYTEPSEPLPTVPLTIAGWGGTDNSNDGTMSPKLLKAQVTAYERDHCDSELAKIQTPSNRIVQLHKDQLCALGKDEQNDSVTSDTCVGDSGGPLELTIGRRKYIVGLTSIGRICGTSSPGIYTRVSQFIGWIESIVWP